MEIRRAGGEGSPIEVTPTPGRSIIDRFVDHETGFLVVQEIRTDVADDPRIYCTLVDPRTAAVVPPELRQRELAGWEKVVEDEVHGLRLRAARTLDPQTGQETLEETLTEMPTGRVVASRSSSAFSSGPRESLLTSFLARRREAEELRGREPAETSLEEKGGRWLAEILRHMRMQSEAGLDEYSLFTPERYAEWRAQEPDIDRILQIVIAGFPDDTETFRAEISRRLGRAL